jgi:hypothetical protein
MSSKQHSLQAGRCAILNINSWTQRCRIVRCAYCRRIRLTSSTPLSASLAGRLVFIHEEWKSTILGGAAPNAASRISPATTTIMDSPSTSSTSIVPRIEGHTVHGEASSDYGDTVHRSNSQSPSRGYPPSAFWFRFARCFAKRREFTAPTRRIRCCRQFSRNAAQVIRGTLETYFDGTQPMFCSTSAADAEVALQLAAGRLIAVPRAHSESSSDPRTRRALGLRKQQGLLWIC